MLPSQDVPRRPCGSGDLERSGQRRAACFDDLGDGDPQVAVALDEFVGADDGEAHDLLGAGREAQEMAFGCLLAFGGAGSPMWR